MRTVSIFKNGNNRAIRLPRDLDFEGVSELEIVREGDSIILRPVRPTWGSFAQLEKADPDLWRSARTLSETKDDLTCEQDLYARHEHMLVHHARAAGSRPEAPGAGGAAGSPHRCLGHHLLRDAFRRHRSEGLARATCSWLTRSAPASMPSCPGIASRWMRPRRLRWHCASPGRRSVRTTRR